MATDLPIASDFEVDWLITRRNATTRQKEPATGLASVTARISLTSSGAAVGGLTVALTEAGTLGRYVGVLDAAALTSALAAYLGQTVYLIVSKAGDLDDEYAEYRPVQSRKAR